MERARLAAVLVLVVTAVACDPTPVRPSVDPAPRRSTDATPAAVLTDRVGNVLPSQATDAQWRELASRELRLPTADQTSCPVTAMAQLPEPWAGRAAGTGPVYAVGNALLYGERANDGLLPAKVLWIAHPGYPGPALIRGRRIDGPGTALFSDHRAAELRFDLETRVRAEGSELGWRFLPSSVWIDERGCYAFQVDGPTWTTTIVMSTRP